MAEKGRTVTCCHDSWHWKKKEYSTFTNSKRVGEKRKEKSKVTNLNGWVKKYRSDSILSLSCPIFAWEASHVSDGQCGVCDQDKEGNSCETIGQLK